MLGDANPASGNHECSRSGDIESTCGVPARSAGVYQSVTPGAARVEYGIAANPDRSRGGSDRLRKANDFLYRFTLHVETHQESGDLRVRTLARQHFSHDFAGFCA